MHVPTQSVPTRCQAGASASLPLERGRVLRDGVVVYLERDRRCYRSDRSCPCNFYRRDHYDDTFRAEFIAVADDGCISTARRTAGYEWPFQGSS